MSLRKAIDNKCKECIFDNMHEGTWKQQVTECTSYTCPLYPVRPKTKGKHKPTIVEETE